MPALTIIGYLWLKRQSFGIESPSEAIRLVADLLDGGLDCVQIKDQLVLGSAIGATASFPLNTREEWDELVHQTIVDASVADTIHMMSEREDDAV